MVESGLKLNIEGGGFSKEANVSLETKLLIVGMHIAHFQQNTVVSQLFLLQQ